ncbi:hypothetical protein BT96DRAFT_1010265 [Gymnopus androsaceus JB14]|uniref:Uncharacterized protein n=1 Tax=Gymnopus androsaceus JB14 TaxID=1447944 RepID=A0A6A4GB04_9AGAR|nr:hypothetical protein BT96DRAFT_1010265 [Gymnopus androsaceus JB14]
MLTGGLEDVFSNRQPVALSSRPPKKPKISAGAEITSGNERGKGKARVVKTPSDAGTKRTLQQAGLTQKVIARSPPATTTLYATPSKAIKIELFWRDFGEKAVDVGEDGGEH